MSIFRQKLTTFVCSEGVPFVRCYLKCVDTYRRW